MLKPAKWHMTTTVHALAPPSGGGLVSTGPPVLLLRITKRKTFEGSARSKV